MCPQFFQKYDLAAPPIKRQTVPLFSLLESDRLYDFVQKNLKINKNKTKHSAVKNK